MSVSQCLFQAKKKAQSREERLLESSPAYNTLSLCCRLKIVKVSELRGRFLLRPSDIIFRDGDTAVCLSNVRRQLYCQMDVLIEKVDG